MEILFCILIFQKANKMKNKLKADPNQMAYIGRKPQVLGASKVRDSDSWYTPQLYLDAVHAVLGGVDLDPFSSEKANVLVRAQTIFTQANCAFVQSWRVVDEARVFMNPPYSKGLCGRAVAKFIEQYRLGAFVEAIVLVNNATDTRWFQLLVQHCAAMCFTHHRISFWNEDGKPVSGNTRGQAFFYFGQQHNAFAKHFAKFGFVVFPIPEFSSALNN